jgi:hypothetical protein
MEEARQLAEAYGATKFGISEDDVQVNTIGDRSGWPEFNVVNPNPTPGQRPLAEVPVIVREGKVLTGKGGFKAFLLGEGRDDADRTATAWFILDQGRTTEPFGTEKKYRTQTFPDPAWVNGQLVVYYPDPRSSPKKGVVQIDADGTAQIVQETSATVTGF